MDVINLQEMLDTRLQQRQARETGICPVRRQLYTQCFDELIRQVTFLELRGEEVFLPKFLAKKLAKCTYLQ